MHIPDFDVVPENVVESDFQRGNSRAQNLTFLHFLQIILTRKSEIAQFVQFFRNTPRNNMSFDNHDRRIGEHLPFYPVFNGLTQIQLLGQPDQNAIPGSCTQLFNGSNSIQCNFKLNHLTRVHSAYSRFRDNPFQIANMLQLIFNIAL